jgi:hypothetical protein
MEFLGLTLDDYAQQNAVEVWPDNWRAAMFARALGMGSMNIGPGGPVGFRPEAFTEIRRAMQITDDEWPEVFDALQVLEEAALEEIHKE